MQFSESQTHTCNVIFGKLIPEACFYVTEMVRETNSENKMYVTFFGWSVTQGVGKEGLSLRGVAFMTVLAVLTALVVLKRNSPSFCLSYKYKIQHEKITVTVLAVVAILVVTTTALKLNLPFPTS